jgi:DNA-binding NtrC family response regulator
VSSGTVMVIDDDADVREVLQIVLAARGIDTVMAGDGEDALEWIARRGPPAMVLLDLRMPRLDGAAFVERLRQRALSVPVIVLSGDGHAREAAAAIGAQDCLVKPVETATLLEVVRKWTSGAAPSAAAK